MTKRNHIKFLFMIRPWLLLGLLISFLSSCNPERVKYTKELKAEMADSKIKRITNADLIQTVDNLGAKVSATIQKELAAQLQKTTDPAERAKLCQLQNLPRTKAIANQYVLDIRLLGPADIQNKALNPKEREILDAYLYNAKQKLSPISNIQKINDTSFVYNTAVPSDSPICEACFGKQDVPFAVWHLGFRKREVIRRMQATKKK
ncbi:hypothetical protein [Spirosoma endophyticum]|uniref:Uncharacterized protein n=1 Tax=Spirosoma endophyticum TaxID=662367 RepID=A0A1I2G1A2_9BACT|nr:hypothetical protein [Spirosoma endophyticum]SFF10908.1 hypothetical protein SAMN05216167_1295 [Spirosoma endophyticum]